MTQITFLISLFVIFQAFVNESNAQQILPCRNYRPAQLLKQQPGFTCMTLINKSGALSQNSIFQVASQNAKTGEQIWVDRKANIAIGIVRDKIASAIDAEKNCQSLSMKIPTGYPNSQIKNYGNLKSDLMALYEDGVLEVIPYLINRWFWVAKPSSPYYETINLFDKSIGGRLNYDYGSKDDSISMVCVLKQNL